MNPFVHWQKILGYAAGALITAGATAAAWAQLSLPIPASREYVDLKIMAGEKFVRKLDIRTLETQLNQHEESERSLKGEKLSRQIELQSTADPSVKRLISERLLSLDFSLSKTESLRRWTESELLRAREAN
jgi:hypothetical protein